jgi:hypothetical protein
MNLKKKIIPITKILPLEKIFQNHLENISKMILKKNVMNRPLIIDKKYKIVLDGSHRYALLYKLGYKLAPVIEVDYANESIFVGNHLHHRFLYDQDKKITKKEVINRALNKNLYNPRTTRHFFPFRKIDLPTNMNELNKGKRRSIKKLLHKTSLKEEIKFNDRFINEIINELKHINTYVDEQKDVKSYLLMQRKLMIKKYGK